MRQSPRRRHSNRVSRFEAVEPRLFLSGEPVADFWLDYYVDDQAYDEVHTTLADAHDLTGLTEAMDKYGLTGNGQTVAVIDTGVAYDHYALGGGFGAGYRVVGGFDFTAERDANPYDDGPSGSHGTHVAGIIASSDSANPGIATGVDLVGLRVFDDDGAGYFSWVEEALQWVHDNRFGFENPITTVNLSLGTSFNGDAVPSWAMLEDEFAQLESDGIFISVAAGNGFTAYNTPGLSYPAVSPHVVPVASVDGDGMLSYFSQRDGHVIAAPGRSIRSTVPDYIGDGNGIDDDFVQYSGTSMASPYVAGASVLLREAHQFAGIPDVDQQTIYDLMVSTADTVYDSQTGLSYHRLNLDAALDAVMPDDEFGSTAAAAYGLGTVADTYALNGTIGQLDDQDWFSFTAGATDSVTFEADTTGGMLARWECACAAQGGAIDGNVLAFDVTAGQTYTVGLASNAGLGHYSLEMNLEPSARETDWGTVRQSGFEDCRIDADGWRFTVTAAADGLLTVEAFFDHAAADVDLQLFDADGRLVGASYSAGDTERIDVTASAGDTFTLRASTYGGGVNDNVDFRVTNLVSLDGNAVHVSGTDADDVFTFAAGDMHRLSINGVEYQFDADAVRSVTFDGGGGADSATLTGTAGAESAVLRAGSAELLGTQYNALATGVETITVLGGGGDDTVRLYDSAGDDLFVGAPQYAAMFGEGFSNQARGFNEVHAFATAGGHDKVKLYDSAGDDLFVGAMQYAAMFGVGFTNQARGFDEVHAFATAGGHDKVKLYDSVGNDTYYANPTEAALFGEGFYNRGKFFEEVHAFATAGGDDTAFLYDSQGDDTFYSNTVEGAMFGNGFYNRAKFFENLHAHSTGGNDRSFLYDSSGDDRLEASADRAWLSAGNAATWVYGFEYVRAQADRGGDDTAELHAVDYILELDGAWS